MSFAWDSEFDLGQFLGIGLSTAEIGYLAGALFFGLFGLSALRRAGHTTGVKQAVWIAVALALLAGALHLAARGFPEQIPEAVRPWTDPDHLVRAVAVLALLEVSVLCVSGHWVSGALARWVGRVAGLVLAGVAVWLAAGWFSGDLPADVRPWTANTVIARAVIVLALAFLAAAFWVRQSSGPPHVRWANRALCPAALAFAVILAWVWFGSLLGPDLAAARVERVSIVLGLIAFGTCLLIAGGAYVLRERPAAKRPKEDLPPRPTLAARPPSLPVALLLDERGQPVIPHASRGQSGSAGA